MEFKALKFRSFVVFFKCGKELNEGTAEFETYEEATNFSQLLGNHFDVLVAEKELTLGQEFKGLLKN